jgi:hypothetical protein
MLEFAHFVRLRTARRAPVAVIQLKRRCYLTAPSWVVGQKRDVFGRTALNMPDY